MPELPEVETTRLGIRSHILNRSISSVILRDRRLRLPVPSNLHELCKGQKITDVSRRAKYLLIRLENGVLLIHLGMSGHLRLTSNEILPNKHDHIDVCFDNNLVLRYHDPRRFGAFLYISEPAEHPLLKNLGPEPLSDEFNGELLFQLAKNRKQTIKSFIMNSRIVVGVGNIYATECLFLTGIHPQTPAGFLLFKECVRLVTNIKKVLEQSIKVGGTTLRDFFASDGKPGYFSNELLVYGKKDAPCPNCGTPIETQIIAGRNSAFCPKCQPIFNLRK